MSEVNNWIANEDFSIHPIQRCNNCDAVFQGPHRCEYEDLMEKNKKLRMELYDIKMKEKTAELFEDVEIDNDTGQLILRLLKADVENMRLREALEFYADEDNWIPHEGISELREGEKARQALEVTK